jgi:hypothetical protein
LSSWFYVNRTTKTSLSRVFETNEFYGPDEEGESTGVPVLGIIEKSVLNQEVGRHLWETVIKYTTIKQKNPT